MKKITLFFACIFACISIFFIMETYAKYLTSADGTANIGIARWNILVNEQSIKNGSSLSQTLTPVFPGSAHIKPGIIAPTAKGHFDIDFDFTNVDVSFVYNITISANEKSVVKDLVIIGYAIDDDIEAEKMVEFEDLDTNISDQIKYEDNIGIRKIRVYIMWDDTSENTIMNNLQDTEATKVENGQALIDVAVSFTQTTK